MSTDQEILILVVSLVLSAFFSGSEAALLSLPHEKAKQIAEEHGVDSWAMKKWLEIPNDLLTTILVGNKKSRCNCIYPNPNFSKMYGQPLC